MSLIETTRPAFDINVKTEHNITLGMLEDWLVTAFEGGCNYWYHDLAWFNVPARVEFPHAQWIYCEGAYITFTDSEDEKKYKITLEDLRKGTQTLADSTSSKRLGVLIREEYDAEDADVWFQMCVFGDIIYG